MDTFFVVTAPGLERITMDEMRRVGVQPKQEAARRDEWRMAGEESGGVEFEGKLEHLYKANLGLRTASRVLVRLGDFYAVSFQELRKKAGHLPWDRFLSPGQPVTMHVTCHKSKLYHSDAVAERVVGAIGDRLGRVTPVRKPGEDARAQLVVVRFFRDHCTISIDSSGELLHRRGYRLETAKAPLRETLAAALLFAAGWDSASPLLDPFCGSGTIAIEAAQIAQGRAPGAERRFAFMDWPGFQRARWEEVLASREEKAAAKRPAELPKIQASDRDAGAIRIAQANAERAGVAEAIEFSCRALSAVEPPSGPGWVVTNPPYGLRVSGSKDLRNLYAQLGNVLRANCPGWRVAILSNDLSLLAQTGLPLDTSLTTINGGVNVHIARGQVP